MTGHAVAGALDSLTPRPSAVSIEQAVYGSFPFRDQGYAMLSASPGCRSEWLVDFRIACQNLGERPSGAVEAPALFSLRLRSGPRVVVGVFPQGRDDRGRPGALAFHGLFLSSRVYRALGADPFVFQGLLKGDWDGETSLTPATFQPSASTLAPLVEDPRASRIATALIKGRRVAIESPGPIDDLARQVWQSLPKKPRSKLSVSTWAFGNGNRFDFLAAPRLVGLSFDRSYLDPLSFEGMLENEETAETVTPSLWCSPAALTVLGLAAALALGGVAMALRGVDDRDVSSPRPSKAASTLPESAGGMPPPSTPLADEDPVEHRRAAEAIANLADRFELDDGISRDPSELMERFARVLRYRGPLLSEAERKELARDTGHDAALALRWDAHVRKFLDDRTLPPAFRDGPIRRQIDTLAWSFHAENEAKDPGGTVPKRSAAEVAHALVEALAIDLPLRPSPLAERFPALAEYLVFLNRLPRR